MNCEHEDVHYSKNEKGAVACWTCGRLFGHLVDNTFIAFNPSLVLHQRDRKTSKRTMDFTHLDTITMSEIAASGATDALVTLEQARELYTEMQHLVRWEAPADHYTDGAFRVKPHVRCPDARWHGVTLRPQTETQASTRTNAPTARMT